MAVPKLTTARAKALIDFADHGVVFTLTGKYTWCATYPDGLIQHGYATCKELKDKGFICYVGKKVRHAEYGLIELWEVTPAGRKAAEACRNEK